MSKELFVKAEEVARELGISKPYAYKLVREMNEELKQKEGENPREDNYEWIYFLDGHAHDATCGKAWQ